MQNGHPAREGSGRDKLGLLLFGEFVVAFEGGGEGLVLGFGQVGQEGCGDGC